MPFLYKSAFFPHQCFAFAQQALTTRTVFHDAASSPLQARRCEFLCESVQLAANRRLEKDGGHKNCARCSTESYARNVSSLLWILGEALVLLACSSHPSGIWLACGCHAAAIQLAFGSHAARAPLASSVHSPRIQLAHRSHLICI